MATADGAFFSLGFYSDTIYRGAKGNRMRAWNTVTVDWEIWTSVGSPDVNPPSGDPVTYVTLIGITEE